MKPILIIEDEQALAAALAATCRRLGYEPRAVYSGTRGLEELATNDWALAIVDIGLPDMSGLEVLERIRERAPGLPVLVVTAHGNLDNAVAARKLGAAAYLVKPLELREVQETLRQVLSVPTASVNGAGRAVAAPAPALLVGAAPAMQRSFVEIAHACTSDAPVLLSGPTGTGKTHTARIIHAQSARWEGPFVTLHCSALPEALLETELFGHERGAFTGAGAARSGHLERAHGGTLFLDEIADISLATQAKLLRFVEERTFTRVGGRADLRVELRLITATHRDLRAEVRAGRFREDLYYRLHVLEISLPPLAERLGDLPALAAFFLGSLTGDRHVTLAPSAMELLARHDWPGNIRELRNVLEHAVAVCPGPVILPQHLPRALHLSGGNGGNGGNWGNSENSGNGGNEETVGAVGDRENLGASETRPTGGNGAIAGDGGNGDAPALEPALAGWLQEQLAARSTYREIHDRLEALALNHLLTHFGGKPTVLARETRMNRVTLRKKVLRLSREQPPAE